MCRLSGTSIAAPHVSGVAALILEKEPTLSAAEVKARLLEWAWKDLLNGEPADANYIGSGSPNVLARVPEDTILADGFETGDFSAWSSNSTM